MWRVFSMPRPNLTDGGFLKVRLESADLSMKSSAFVTLTSTGLPLHLRWRFYPGMILHHHAPAPGGRALESCVLDLERDVESWGRWRKGVFSPLGLSCHPVNRSHNPSP